jgi:hypothetical protein
MAYEGKVYRLLIASPSDVEDEREVVVKVIQEWNDLHSFSRKVVLLPLRWETHTAPEYGTRPQEVINRAIVDQCDVLIGMFWTRIGTPTGESESGTIEEISRVASLGKPVMLYFSKIGADPDTIDVAQLLKVKEFKDRTYPNALVESYKSLIEFHDKFAKQLEIKVRELQRSDEAGPPPLSLSFVSTDSTTMGELQGNTIATDVHVPEVNGFEEVPQERRKEIQGHVETEIDVVTCVPVVLAITNASSSGIRNVFVEMRVTVDTTEISISKSPPTRKRGGWNVSTAYFSDLWLTETDSTVPSLPDFEHEGLMQHDDSEWVLKFEWDAIQPQRVRHVRYVFLMARASGVVTFKAKVFADSFATPMLLEATMVVSATKVATALDAILPKWRKLLERQFIDSKIALGSISAS